MKKPIVGVGASGLSGRRTELSGWQVVVVCFQCAQHAIPRDIGSSTELGISIGATLQLDFPRFQALCQIIGRGEYAVEYWSLVAVNDI